MPWIALVLLGLVGWGAISAQTPTYPVTHRDDAVVDDYHGTKVADPYRWLEELDSPATIDWVDAQARFTRDRLERLPGRAAIRRRLNALWRYSRTEVPWREAGRLLYLRNTGVQPQPVLYVQNGFDDRPRPLLDPGKISPDGSIAVQDFAMSPDGRLLAYRMARGGGGVAELRVRDLSTGRELPEVVNGVLTSVCQATASLSAARWSARRCRGASVIVGFNPMATKRGGSRSTPLSRR